MRATAASADFIRSTSTPSRFGLVAPTLLFLGLLWLEVVRQLKPEWSLNPQYGYGWSVPFLSLYLIWKRWPERPAPVVTSAPGLTIALLALCALVLAPIRFVAEANPDWRFLSWALAFVAVTMSIFVLYLHGGRTWVRYFAFPVLFFLVAVPWPTQFEQFVIQNLMRAVTGINVAFLNLAGIPALQHGNVVEVGTGLIGIEEACSGVRSLQATFMISLFLGDLYSFDVARRISLVIAGAVLAFICNLVRTAILVWMGARSGASAIEAWHDPAGLSILMFCLFGLWLLSLLMRRYSPPEVASPSIGHHSAPLLHSSSRILLPLAVWLLLIEGGIQVWYRTHQSAAANSRWTVQWPNEEQSYQNVPIPTATENLLHYNEGGGASWQATDGRPWMMYFFRWFPGQTAARFVKIHRPDVCLPASGMTMVSDDGMRILEVNGVKLPIRSYRFDDHGAPLHVFYCYWDARSSYENVAAATDEDWSARGRVRAAMRGRRELGAQMLEVVVWGFEDDREAGAALQHRLAQIIHSP